MNNISFEQALDYELDWLKRLFMWRFETHAEDTLSATRLPPPPFEQMYSPFSDYLQKHQVDGLYERLGIDLALFFAINPALLIEWMPNQFLSETIKPSIGLWLHLLFPHNFQKQLTYLRSLTSTHSIWNVLVLDHNPHEAIYSASYQLHPSVLHYWQIVPTHVVQFPAQALHTELCWKDLYLTDSTKTTLEGLIAHQKDNRPKPPYFSTGIRALFHGPPGTGKTLTATLLGQQLNKTVYRVNLAQVSSKYIGETAKQLERLFDFVLRQKAILFFDEADALFGKRNTQSNQTQHYANQEVAYLLQRIEQYPELLILATNHKEILDKAFQRRFQYFVHFPIPDFSLRIKIWQNYLQYIPRLTSLSYTKIARDYILSPAEISIVAQKLFTLSAQTQHMLTEIDVEQIAQEEVKKKRLNG